MKILALEFSSARGGLALLNRGDFVFFRDWQNDRKNSGSFFEYLAEVRAQFGNPDIVIVGLGPGSYAGTRIAISAGIGLQASSNARLVGFPSICAIECDAAEYCVIGDARRDTFFFALVQNNNLIEGPTLMAEAELREKIAKPDRRMPIFSTERLSQFERADVRYPSAKVLARLTNNPTRRFATMPLEPIYLREPHITVPKR